MKLPLDYHHLSLVRSYRQAWGPLKQSRLASNDHGLRRKAKHWLQELPQEENQGKHQLSYFSDRQVTPRTKTYPTLLNHSSLDTYLSVQCDEQRPACTQCTTTNRICPGYAHLFDLVLRDQTESVTRKAQQRKRRHDPADVRATSTAAEASVTAVVPGLTTGQRTFRTSSSHIASPTYSGYFLPLSLPKSFHDSPEEQAINGFFQNYVLIPRHHHSRRGYLDCLLPLYQNARHDSLLSLATTAMALAIEGGAPSRAHYRKLSQSFFGRALVKTGRAIRDPVESIKDETLMAVLLLSFYEVCSFYHPLFYHHYLFCKKLHYPIFFLPSPNKNGMSTMFRRQL